VGTTYKYGKHCKKAIETLTETVFTRPPNPPDNADKYDVKVWEKEIDDYMKTQKMYEENMGTIYSLIWGQCSTSLQAKLEAKAGYAAMHAAQNAIELLKSIKDTTHSFKDEKWKAHALYESKQRFFLNHQDRNMSVANYREKFMNLIEVLEHSGGSIHEEALVEEALGNVTASAATPEQLKDAMKKAREEFMACAFLLGADRNRYGKLVEDLENSYIQKHDIYPKTLNDAYNLLLHWKHDARNQIRATGTDSEGVAFVQTTDTSQVTCYLCKKKGHYANKCPKKDNNEEGEVHVQEEATNKVVMSTT
jgi:hypothetical protein